MNEPSVPLGKIIVIALWSLVASLIACGWIAWALHAHDLAAMLGLTGCASSAAAATAHIRRYASRICFIIRTLGMGGRIVEDGTPVRLMRD